MWLRLVFLFIVLSLPNNAVAQTFSTIFSEDFETTPTITDVFNESGNTGLVTSASYTCGGETRNSMRATLDRTDPVEFRSEVIAQEYVTSPGDDQLKFDRVFRHTFDFCIPSGFVQDDAPEIFHQLHGQPDQGNGEAFRSPNLGFRLSGDGVSTDYVIFIRGDTKALTPSSGGESRYTYSEEFNLGSADGDINSWVEWTYEIYYTAEENAGYVKVWKDDVLVFEKYDITTAYNDDEPGYLKWGVYKWFWDSSCSCYDLDTGATSRTNYYDNLLLELDRLIEFNGVTLNGVNL